VEAINMGEISGNVGVSGTINAGVSGRPNEPPLDVDVSIGLKDAAFAIGGIPGAPLIIDLMPLELIGDPSNPITANVTANVNAGLTGDKTKPVSFDATIAAGLDNIGFTVKGDPNNPVTIDAGLDDIGFTVSGDPNNPVTIDLGLDDINLCLSLGITQLPSVQVHMPTSSCVGLSLLGIPIFNLSFEGRWGLTTQDNPPRIFQGDHQDEPMGFRRMPEHLRSVPDITVSLDPEA
jgi:hypothetical protein